MTSTSNVAQLNSTVNMGGGLKVDFPDHKIYKIDDHPDFVKLQERLAAKGLKDPWLR